MRRADGRHCSAQVWANCRLYNQDESDIVQLANDLARQFLAAWQDRGLPVVPAAAASQPQPPSSPPAKRQLPAAQLAADGGVQRGLRRGQQADLMPRSQTAPSGHQAQPGAQPVAVNGCAKHNRHHATARSRKRSKHVASASASSASGEDHHGLSSSHAEDDAKPLSRHGVSSAPLSTDGLQDVVQRPSIKITLRTASAVKSIVPVPQKQDPPHRKLTVKLRASSADNRRK